MRASTSFPKKTPLGVEEMRQRTHGLSQRHRTMLLLVNGKRERREVLTLAGQAGVDAAVLDELVSIGLVDPGVDTVVPTPKAPRSKPRAAAGAPAPSVPPAREDPRPEPVGAASLAPEPALPDDASPADESPTDSLVPPMPPPKPAKASRVTPPPPPVGASAPAPQAPAPDPAQSAPAEGPAPLPAARVRFAPPVHRPRPPPRHAAQAEVRRFDKFPVLSAAKPPVGRTVMQMTPPAAPADDEAEQKLIAEVRNLLIGTLLVDGPVSSSLTALRVRKARTRGELAALVWEIERRLTQARRPREPQSRLIRARELLGLGNTVVEGEDEPEDDTEPGAP